RAKLAADFPERGEYWSGLAGHRSALAGLYLSTGQPREAEKAQRGALEAAAKATAHSDASSTEWETLGLLYLILGSMLQADNRRHREAAQAYRRALETFQQEAERFPAHASSDHPYHWHVALTHADLGRLLRQSGRTGEAADHFRRAADLLTRPGVNFPDSAE